MQCAEPVTGSSGIPCAGAKKRDTKSQSLPGAVAITANLSSRFQLLHIGLKSADFLFRPIHNHIIARRPGSLMDCRPDLPAMPAGSFVRGGRAGKSNARRSPLRVTLNSPDFVLNRIQGDPILGNETVHRRRPDVA